MDRSKCTAVLAAVLLFTGIPRPTVHAGRPSAGPSRAGSDHVAPVAPQLINDLRSTGRAEAVVTLDDGVAADAPDDVMARAVARVQDEFLAGLQPGDFDVIFRPTLLPVLSGFVSESALSRLRRIPAVVDVGANERYYPSLAEAVPLIHADRVWETYGITGEGVTVAVLDTGIDVSHPDFAGKIMDQHCYSSSRSCSPNNTVESSSAQDEAGHGTAVSGIIASKGAVAHKGVAPDANLVAVRVFRDEGYATTADIISGLDFVLRRAPVLNIRVVNMSLGHGGSVGVNCDSAEASTKQAFQRLVARNVSIFVATGNNGFTDRVSSPACISNSIAVGATYDADYPRGACGPDPVKVDDIACFTNRGRAMDLLAPGIWISSSKLGGGVTEPGAGTSFAAPMAAGVAALIAQADPSLRPRDVEQLLKDTGVPITNTDSGDVYPRVDALAAVAAVVPATSTPTASSTPSPTATAAVTTAVPPTDAPTATETPAPGTASATATRSDVTPAPTASGGSKIYLPATSNGALIR